MKNIKRIQFIALWLMLSFLSGSVNAQFSCATATPIGDGQCRTGQTMGGSLNLGGSCLGGGHPTHFYSFTAPANGDCVQFDISNPSASGDYQALMYTAGCGSYVSGSLTCIDNVVAGNPFTVSGYSSSGTNNLVPGQSYVLIIHGDPMTFDICLNTPSNDEPANECSGALNLSSQLSYYNGGDCDYSGSYDDAGSGDPAANLLCAGSLENTQWITFTASSTANITLTGQNISCTGGGCGFQFGMFSAGVGGSCCGGLTSLGCYGNKVCSGGQPSAGPTNPGGRLTWSGTSSTGFTVTISGVQAGEVFCFIMDGNADADCIYELFATGILPIGLQYFKGYSDNGNVNLNWSTLSEFNASHFEVLKSRDGQTFNNIGQINANNAGDQQSFYSFTDNNAEEGKNLYRIKMFDLDGSFTWSSTIEVNNLKNMAAISIANNVATLHLDGELMEMENVNVRFNTMDGRTVYEQLLDTKQSNYTYDLNNVGAGVYICTLSGPGFVQNIKFIVK